MHGFNRRMEKRMPLIESFALDGATRESCVGEDPGTKRLAAQTCQPTAYWPAWPAGQYRMRKNYRFAIAEQCHLPYPGQPFASDTEFDCFITCRHGKTLTQNTHGKASFCLKA